METLAELNEHIKKGEEQLAYYDEKRKNGEVLSVLEAMAFSNYIVSVALLYQLKERLLTQSN